MGCDFAVGHERGMRNALEWKAWGYGGRSRVHGVEAARRGGTSPAGGVRAVPALGSAGKGVCAHAQDATRPKIRPAGPNAQRRGARRGAAALGRRRAGSGPKGCTAAYTIVPKRTSGRSRSSPSFGLKRRPAQSARRRRPAAEVGRSSWRDPEEGALGLLVPEARPSGTWRCWETGRRGRSGTGCGELRRRSSCVVKQGRRLCAVRREAESGERGEGAARAACYLRREREARGERDSTRGRRRSRRGCRAEVARGGRKEGRGRC